MLLKCCTQYARKYGKLSSGHRTIKVSFHSNPKKGQYQRVFKLLHNFTHFTYQQSNSQTSPRLASIVHEQRTSWCSFWVQKRQKKKISYCQHPLEHRKSKIIPGKYLLLLYLLYALWITINRKILKGMGLPDHLNFLQRNLYAGQETTVRTNSQSNNSQTGSKLGKEYVKAVYCHPAYLTSMQSTSCEMLGWMKHKLESRLPGEIYNVRYADETTLMAENKEELQSFLMKLTEESKKLA